jgi:Tfp pilus assembly PilM family ATPase
MNGINRCAGINVTASRFQFVEVEKVSDQLFITNLGQTFISPSINFEVQNETELLGQLQTAFDEINIQNPVNSSIVSFTLPPELFITIQLPYDNNLTQAEITEEFRWEISQLFPFLAADELAIKFYDLSKEIFPGNYNALVVALNKKYLLLLKNFCTKNKLSPRLVDNASITANAFINTYSQAQDSITVNIYNSKNSITFFINISSKPAYVKVFQKTTNDFSNSIVKILSEEKIKKIFTKLVKFAFFSGDDIGTELQSEFRQVSGLEFIKFNPFKIVKFKTDLHSAGISGEQYSTFTSATGIAARFNKTNT